MKINTADHMITNYNEVKVIMAHGTPCTVTIHKIDRDGYGYDVEVDALRYAGHTFVIRTDRDGWPIAWVKD